MQHGLSNSICAYSRTFWQNMIASPMISAWLVSRGIRLPWIVASCSYAVTLPLAMALLPETLGHAERKPFAFGDFVRRANPLTFTRLFTNGTRLRALALLECIGSLCDGRATWQVQNLHRQQLMGWEVATRGRFMSVTSVFSTAGYAVAARMFSRL